jgi:pilus assembly protein CpaC
MTGAYGKTFRGASSAGRNRGSAGAGGRGSLAILALLILLFVGAGQADAADRRDIYFERGGSVAHVAIPLNKSETIRLDRPFAEARVGATETAAGPPIAEIVPLNDHSLYVLGRRIGTTNISLFDSFTQLIGVIEVEVTLDVGLVQAKIREVTGNPNITVTSSGSQLILSGVVPDAQTVDQAVKIARQFAAQQEGTIGSAEGNGQDNDDLTVVNALSVTTTQQVLLKVRFVEATRAAGRELGIRWDLIGNSGRARLGFEQYPPGTFPPNSADTRTSPLNTAGALLLSGAEPFGVVLARLVNNGFSIDLLLKALEDKSLVRVLAEPNLVTLSGDTASFHAGGKFPVPVASTGDNPPGVRFESFGVLLSFTPTVLRNGHVNLRLHPEVSSIDPSVSGAFGTPGISTRRASTTIELRDGQSFAIAGLLQSSSTREIAQLPWISSIPVLGALFRSTRYQNRETDLVIIVTPHLVMPGAPGNLISTPLDGTLPANDPDLFLKGKLELPKGYRYFVETGGQVKGPYGHILGLEFGYDGIIAKN